MGNHLEWQPRGSQRRWPEPVSRKRCCRGKDAHTRGATHTYTHTHCMLIPGPSLAPGIAVPGDWPFCPLTTALSTVQDTKGPKVSHTAPGDGGGGGCWKATVTPFLPDCSMWLFRPGPAEQPQQTDTQRELWLSVLARTLPPQHPWPLLFGTRPLSGLKIDPALLLGWDPRGCLRPEEKRELLCLLEAPSAHQNHSGTSCQPLLLSPGHSGDTCKGPQLPALGLPGSSSQPYTNASPWHRQRRGPAQVSPTEQG